ncbi:hypothetical protein [Corynebacterium kroppenstedtii]|jgi:hypothetical protein|uniref:Uncharacterized protein n=1 Tax=Corynebacterium kroppenstedtii TaxID=161879 RepID=A0A2W5UB54_9CORY|nr:hypothetical protein [Corynebacterium kroppenstedtii]MDU7286428.1 hypothetical protein [Corynebacterium kroppenstedtii]PZR06168.1 MAG: hypothetical protein DI525_02415 [Corynebacterium kroppenstedtii]
MTETGSITAQPDALRTASDQLAGCADTVSRLRDGYEANPPSFTKCSRHIPALQRTIELLGQNHDRLRHELGRFNESLLSISQGTRTLADAVDHSDTVAAVRMNTLTSTIPGNSEGGQR